MIAARLGALLRDTVGVGLLALVGCGGRTPPAQLVADTKVERGMASDDHGADAGSDQRDDVQSLACNEACAQMGAILAEDLASLGPEAELMRREVAASAGEPCVTACEARGDAASVACMIAAKTVLELGACQAPR